MKTLEDLLTVKPWDHQTQAYDFLAPRRYGGLFADMGTGKSAVAIGLIGQNLGRWLIVCPLAMVDVWTREIEKFASYPVDVVPLRGSIRERCKTLMEGYSTARTVLNEGGDRVACVAAKVFVVNYEAFQKEEFVEQLEWIPIWDGLILDESHRIKSNSSTTTKRLTKLGASAMRRFIMTGTPAADKPIDIFAQYRFLDPTIFGKAFYPFRNRYTIGVERVNSLSGNRFYEIQGYQNQEELSAKMYEHAFRVTDEVLDLPSRVPDTRITVELKEKAKKAYRSMLKQSLVEIGDGTATAANVLAKLLRLQQITSGYLQPEPMPGQEAPPLQILGTEKRDALADLFQSLGPEPVVVFYRFDQDRQTIRHAMKLDRENDRTYFELSGHRNELAAWQEDTGPSVLAVQIKAGGSGVSTVRASKVVYLSLTYSLTDYEQSRARARRPGQTRPVNYYTISAKDTIDEVIEDALASKRVDTKYLVDELRRRAS